MAAFTAAAPITEFEITAETGSDKILYVRVGFPETWDVREDGPNGRPLGMIALVHGGAGFGAATIGRPDGQRHRDFAPTQFADAARWLYANA